MENKGHGDEGGSNPSAPPQAPPPYDENFGHGQFSAEMKPPTNNGFDPVPPTIGFVDPSSSGAMPMPPQEPEATPIVILDPPPPPYSECVFNVDCPTSEEDVKAALLNFYKDDCCFDPKTVDGFFIHEITQMHAFRYVLDTFTEKRTLQEMTEPYKNQQIDGPQNGPSPDKWAVFANPPQEFIAKAKAVMDLPRSANVIPCNKCHSTGFTACNSCNGMGFSRCTWCSGSGRRQKSGSPGEYENCSSCNGMGRNNCTWCQLGRIQCKTCKGHRFLKVWQSLTIRWKTEGKVHETARGELKPRHLKKARIGELLSSTKSTPQNPQPLNCTLDRNILSVSTQLIGEQLQKQDMNSRVIQFRQSIGVIPVVKVIYQFKNKEGHFYVFGNTRLVYFPGGYPGGCACCCTIM